MQTARTLATLNRLARIEPVGAGRVVPDTDDITIHEGRRLDAVVMFLDICKFSGRPAWTEQEQEVLLRVLSLFFTEMIKTIEDYGGVVEKNTGDGLMAYFVRQPEDSVFVHQRALSAALTMFSAAERLINPVIEAAQIERIRFRICMDHGPITVAKVGAARGFNGIVAVGTTANIASKMLAVADPDSILLGSRMLAGLPPSWTREYVRLKTLETGWLYRANDAPYAFWEYTGRWTGALP